VAALKLSDRVSSISLTATGPLVAKFSAFEEPFSELEELVLLSHENVQLTLPSTFRWGPHLSILQSTRIAFPSLPQLLLPSHCLTELQLDEIPSAGYFSPEAFADALSGMTQLRTISLHFLSLPPRRNFCSLPLQSGERDILPDLTCLKYRGTSKYLDCLIARIDAPSLQDVCITFFNQPTLDASQLGRFIKWIEMQNSSIRADVVTSERAISISFTWSGGPISWFQLEVSCEQLDWQLFSMAQICQQFVPFPLRIKDLSIVTTRLPREQIDMDSYQWLELIRTFGGVKDFRIVREFTTDIMHSLCPSCERHTIVLPALRNLHLHKPTSRHREFRDSVELFVTQRRLSSRPLEVYTSGSRRCCQICGAGYNLLESLVNHFNENHRDGNLCPYCCDFNWPEERNDLFRQHLKSTHPQVPPTFSNPAESLITPPELDDTNDQGYWSNNGSAQTSSLGSPLLSRSSSTDEYLTYSAYSDSDSASDALHDW